MTDPVVDCFVANCTAEPRHALPEARTVASVRAILMSGLGLLKHEHHAPLAHDHAQQLAFEATLQMQAAQAIDYAEAASAFFQ